MQVEQIPFKEQNCSPQEDKHVLLVLKKGVASGQQYVDRRLYVARQLVHVLTVLDVHDAHPL